ncbi:DNA-binding response regulator, LuxR family protein [Minicystis rosea]|nr:DNA-binding response regulator, LuxR family protein [Minicystis rosea]
MIRVFIADDHTIVRRGIRQVLSDAGDIEVVGEAADGRATLKALEAPDFDVLVLDLSLPKVNGPEVLRRQREQAPGLRVVILSMYPEEQYALRLLRDGAAAYIAKDRPVEELIAAVRAAAAGRTYVTPGAARLAETKASGGAPHEALSPREHQVFMLLFKGLAVADIAAELNLSSSTVSNHIATIKTKLGVRTVTQIVSYAHRAGLTP